MTVGLINCSSMGRASRAKAQARAALTSRDRPNLLRQLREHVDFLKASAGAFDSGFEAEAKRLAVSLRVLLHDTSGSRALLGQLDVKNKLRFTETSEPMNPYSLGPTPGLVLSVYRSVSRVGRMWPRLAGYPRLALSRR